MVAAPLLELQTSRPPGRNAPETGMIVVSASPVLD